jgi:O-glycosyl hydrolase
VVQRHSQWTGGDPNPGTAFLVSDKGELSIERGYALFKHYCPIGRAGMAVAETQSNTAGVMVSAFGANGTANSDAMVVINSTDSEAEVSVGISGSNHESFRCIVSDDKRSYEAQPDLEVSGGKVSLTLAKQGIATLIGK